jgi:DAK2 domain fusion protein YloV
LNVRLVTITAVEGALAAIEAERSVVNDLNVYPVPDGDTGTNLTLTVRAIAEELQHSPAQTIPEVAAAVTKGSLMGARGNSGVILSQIVRGICEEWARSRDLTTASFQRALHQASACAYRAVREPVEGTMLTVIREMAAAGDSVPDAFGLKELMLLVEEAGRIAVENTTSQLAVLEKAGVVDAGGYGLLVLYRGLCLGLAEAMLSGIRLTTAEVRLHSTPTGKAASAPAAVAAPVVHGHSELSQYRYCTSLLIRGDKLDMPAIESYLHTIGDSALAVGDPRMVKIHVHTNDPGVVISKAVTLGSVGEVEINDMHEQTKARDERLQEPAPAPGAAVIAVVAGEGNKELFRELGCKAIVDGGQSMNPSAAQFVAAVEELGAREVVILPNNSNVILTAEQAAGMSPGHVAVVPTASLPAGLAAMVAYDPEADAVANARAMEDAISELRSAEVTTAVRACELDGVAVRRGQAMGLVDGRLVGADDSLVGAAAAVFEEFARGGAEYVTVLTALNGSDVSREQLAALAADRIPDAEVHFHEGGQPLYPILASAE